MGGRAAEEVVHGTRTTGAESDIEQASALARQMVTRWGMSDRLGLMQLAPRQTGWTGQGGGFIGEKPCSDETAKLIDMEVGRIIEECHADARRLIGEHRAALDALVAALMAKELLDEKEILVATGLPPAPALPDRPLVSGQDIPEQDDTDPGAGADDPWPRPSGPPEPEWSWWTPPRRSGCQAPGAARPCGHARTSRSGRIPASSRTGRSLPPGKRRSRA